MNKVWLKSVVAAGIAGSLLCGGLLAYAASTPAGDQPPPRAAMNWGAKKGHPGGKDLAGRGGFADAASVLGMDAAALKAELQAGKTLAEIAAAKGVTKDTLIANLTALAQTRLDEAVKSGRLTTEKATVMKESIAKKITESVDKKMDAKMDAIRKDGHKSKFAGQRQPGKFGHGGFKQFDQVAGLLQMEPQALKDELKAGKSLAEIASAKGISTDQLKAQLLDLTQKEMASLVQQGKLTQEQADTFKQHAEKKIDLMIQHKGFGNKDAGKFKQVNRTGNPSTL